MANPYFNLASSTAVATAISLFTVGSVPAEVYELPPIPKEPYGAYAAQNASIGSSDSLLSEHEQAEILTSFAQSLVMNTKNLNPMVSQAISDDFWNMYERF